MSRPPSRADAPHDDVSPLAGFSRPELSRYARHLALEEVGPEGQRRLRDARVLLIGAGGLGSPAALYLAAAGVGTLGVIDPDEVDLSNLQRQVIHDTAAVGRPKVESARERIAAVNPHVEVEAHRERLTSANALELVRRYDLVVDGSDNFPTRYLVNDACVLTGRPWVYGAILRWEGQLALFGAPDGPCYRCLFAEPPPPGLVPGCAEAGVVGVLPGVIGSLQALEAVKWILARGRGMAGRLLVFDALDLSFREITLRRRADCPVCGDEPTVRELIDYEHFCATGEVRGEAAPGAEVPAGEASGARARDDGEIEPAEVAARIEAARIEAARGDGGLGDGEPLLLDVREEWEWQVGNLAQLGARHIPLRQLPSRLGELEGARRREIVPVCRSGARSGEAARMLREAGFPRVSNLAGGLERWAREVDPSFPID